MKRIVTNHKSHMLQNITHTHINIHLISGRTGHFIDFEKKNGMIKSRNNYFSLKKIHHAYSFTTLYHAEIGTHECRI